LAADEHISRMDVRARRLLRTKEAALYLGMSCWSLRLMVERRELPYISSGDHTSAWRFDIRDLDHWIDAHRIGCRE
jgi:excisionase family DNA binding protein